MKKLLASKSVAVALIVAIMVLIRAAHAEQELQLTFGVYSSNKPSSMVETFRPLLKELEVRLASKLQRDVTIRMQISKDFEQGISDLTSAEVDFSNVDPAAYIEAKRRDDGITVIAVEKSNRSKIAYGIIAVHQDSDFTFIEDIRGARFAFGDQSSTIGRFLSQQVLLNADILGEDLAHYEYLGRHDKVGTAVAAGAFDAGALNEETFLQLINAGEPIRELIRFAGMSDPWIARSKLDPVIRTALQESLFDIENANVLKAMKIDGFLAGNDTDFADIRYTIQNNPAFNEKRNSTSVSQHIELTSSPTPELQSAVPNEQGTASALTKQAGLSDADSQLFESDIINNDSGRITVNIQLSPEMFARGKYIGPDTLTINLKMPSIEQQ